MILINIFYESQLFSGIKLFWYTTNYIIHTYANELYDNFFKNLFQTHEIVSTKHRNNLSQNQFKIQQPSELQN